MLIENTWIINIINAALHVVLIENMYTCVSNKNKAIKVRCFIWEVNTGMLLKTMSFNTLK